ncbi:MAG: hypothetical protein ABW004_13000, partial [Aeromicrobium sp.]
AATAWTIGRLAAGGSIDIRVGDTLVGTDSAVLTSRGILNQYYNPITPGGAFPASPASTLGTFFVKFFPDAAGGAPAFTDRVLAAFGTGATTIASTYDFSDLTAGTSISVQQAGTRALTLVASTDVGTGRIDMGATGPITVTEREGDLRVGVISSTTNTVSLTATDGSLLDATGVEGGAYGVHGTIVTLLATGSIGTVTNRLEIQATQHLTATAPTGVFLTQVAGTLVVDRVTATGDVVIATLAGSLVNRDAATRVKGGSITLRTLGGAIGTAISAIVVDTETTGTLTVHGATGVWVTEASGALTLAGATSTGGGVLVTAPTSLTLLSTTVVSAAGAVVLRAGTDLTAPLGSRVTGATVALATAYGATGPIATRVELGGAVTGSTITVTGGAGSDTVVLFETVLDGQTIVTGGAGDDTVLVTRLTILPGTHGAGIANSLRIDGGNGSNHVGIVVWGIDDPAEHETRIDVIGTGTDLLGINTLTVSMPDGDNVVLLRSVTAIPGVTGANHPAFVAVATGTGTVERISYDRGINGKLTINGGTGDDTFVLDDTSAALTINGGAGDDTFIVGQFFLTERTAPNVAAEDAFATASTNLGWLSAGVSRPAVLYGGEGDDRFIISSNRAELRLEAGDGDDEFVFVTSLRTDLTAPTYVQHGFVSLDGGTGTSTITVLVDTVGDVVHDADWSTLVGGGLAIEFFSLDAAPVLAVSTTIPTPIGLPTETDVATSFRALAVTPTTPYPFADRGAADPVIVTETDGRTGISPTGTDSYTIRLASASTRPVFITITSAYAAGAPFALFSIDGGATWVTRAVLMIAAGDTAAHRVLVRWADPAVPIAGLRPGATVVTLSHTVASLDPAFAGIDIRNVYVNVDEAAVSPVDPEATPLPVPAAVPAALAAAGFAPDLVVLLALLFLLLGAALLVAARRRSA